MRAIPLFAALIVALAGVSGCVDEEKESSAADDTPSGTNDGGDASPTATTSAPPATTEPGSGGNGSSGPKAPVANLTVSSDNLTLSYEVADDAGASGVTGTLDLGDGNTVDITEVPTSGTYDYEAAGDYEVVLTLTNEAGESSETEAVKIAVASGPAGEVQREFKSGPVLGCVTEAGFDHCPAYVAGPEDSAYFGLWIPVEPGHVGLVYSTIADSVGGDTDGWQLDADFGLIEENVNGEKPAGGTVQAATKWILVISWAEPALEIVATFTDPPAE